MVIETIYLGRNRLPIDRLVLVQIRSCRVGYAESLDFSGPNYHTIHPATQLWNKPQSIS